MKFQLVLASVFACLLQTGALAQQADVGTLVERTVERVRQQFPEDTDDRLGSYRTAYFRIGTAKQIQSLVPKSSETKIQSVSTQLIRDWYSANPDAYKEILEFARIQGIAASEIAGVVRNSGLHAIKLGRYEEGERLLSQFPAYPSSDSDLTDLVIAYAVGGNMASADKYLASMLERVPISSARYKANQFARVGYVQGVVKIIERIQSHPEMLSVVVAALSGAAKRQGQTDISTLTSFVAAAELDRLSVEDVVDENGDSWTSALEGCEPARMFLFPPRRPAALAHVPVSPPIVDCFTKPPGAITSLALLLFRSGENELARTVIDRVATLLLSRLTPERIDIYQSALFVRRPVTKQEIEQFPQIERDLSSLRNVAYVASAIEATTTGKKILPTLKSAGQLRPDYLLVLITDPSAFESELSGQKQDDPRIEVLRLEFALRNDSASDAIRSFGKLKRDGKWSYGLAPLYTYHHRHPNSASQATIDFFRAAIREDRRNKTLLSVEHPHFAIGLYIDYLIAFDDRDLARELAEDSFVWALEQIVRSSSQRHLAVANLVNALMDCFFLNATCDLQKIHFRIDDGKSSETFNAILTSILARAGQIENALLHVQRLSQPFPDIKTYPDYLREAWGHLAHAYARQGDIEKALNIIGEGKAGKPGGTIDAVVDGWIAAGHYKRP